MRVMSDTAVIHTEQEAQMPWDFFFVPSSSHLAEIGTFIFLAWEMAQAVGRDLGVFQTAAAFCVFVHVVLLLMITPVVGSVQTSPCGFHLLGGGICGIFAHAQKRLNISAALLALPIFLT